MAVLTEIDPTSVGTTSEPRIRMWTDRDTLLYALGIGAGTEELAFSTENSHGHPQRVYPTFGIVVAGEVGLMKRAGRIDMGRVVHGSQSISLHRPLPAAGSLSVQSEIAEIQDKGEGRNAVLVFAGRGTDPETGELVVETRITIVVRGAGGFGGDPGAKTAAPVVPEREPDQIRQHTTRPDQPLIYRLSGDRNPLHSDPWFATEKAGFPAPILHGLCTYGFAGRALLDAYCDEDPARFASLDARFSSPVVPGDVLTTRMWEQDSGIVVFTTSACGPDGGTERVVLDQGVFVHRG